MSRTSLESTWSTKIYTAVANYALQHDPGRVAGADEKAEQRTELAQLFETSLRGLRGKISHQAMLNP